MIVCVETEKLVDSRLELKRKLGYYYGWDREADIEDSEMVERTGRGCSGNCCTEISPGEGSSRKSLRVEYKMLRCKRRLYLLMVLRLLGHSGFRSRDTWSFLHHQRRR